MLKKKLQVTRHHHGLPCAVNQGRIGVALVYHVTRAVFATTTLGSNAQIYLDIFKALPFTGVLVNFLVRDAMADANNHETLNCVVFDAFIVNRNSSHLHCL